MNVKDAINYRRAYRSLESVAITDELIIDLATHAQLAPSCFNKQPLKFVFVHDPKVLNMLKDTLSTGNAWAKAAPMIIVVFSNPELDCKVRGKEYFLFDVGSAVAFLQLHATELGLLSHPIAGFDENKVKEVLGIPFEMIVITLVIVGKRSKTINPVLSEKQIENEKTRPQRLPLSEFIYKDIYGTKFEND